MTTARGFILQSTYRMASDTTGRRVPVVHLHGRLERGGGFLIRDDRSRPFFYVRAADVGRSAILRTCDLHPVERRTIDGAPVRRVQVDAPMDVPPLRDRLHEAGIETFEADVRFATRFLIDRGIQGGCEIEGEPRIARGGLAIFDNPLLRPADVTIEPRVLAFDIETDARGERLLAISMFAPASDAARLSATDGDAPRIDEVLIVDGSDRPMPDHAVRCVDERAALTAFCERVAALDPDVITGWNIIDFDLGVLQRIATRLRHPLDLGREPGPMRLRKPEGWFGSGQAAIAGRVVLDGIDLLRGAYVRMEDYSLDTVAREVLGEGKAVTGDVRDRVGEILHNYRHDLPAFARYARTDARLAYRIVEKLDLVRLAFARSRLTGMMPDRVAASIASFDFLYLSALARAGLVAPSVGAGALKRRAGGQELAPGRPAKQEAQQGGHVLEPVTGLHPNVWVFDFKSLYPSLIRTFNIDPVSYVPSPPPGSDLIETPGGAFRREPAILPRLLDDLFPRREAAKRRHDDVAAHAIKILMNSFYGVLGTPACRFFNPALANAITGLGKEMLLWSKRWFEAAGFAVLYGDTDSLFVRSDSADPQRACATAQRLAAELNADLTRHIDARWRVRSRLELEFEKLYLKLFLPHARHSTRGASKRYAGLLHVQHVGQVEPAGQGGPHAPEPGCSVEFVGMEVVRRDWTALAKRVQRELFQRLFTDQPVDAWLADVVGRLRRGELDAELVYHKNLRKAAADYTASTPPHVAAARKSARPPGRSVRYVVTVAGPEPLDNRAHPLDREHYVAKQVRPVAEPVLEALGLEFEQVIGDTRQLDLYS